MSKKTLLPAALAETIGTQRALYHEVHACQKRVSNFDRYISDQREKLAAVEAGHADDVSDVAAAIAVTSKAQSEILGCIGVAETRRERALEVLKEATDAATALSRVTTSTALNDARRALFDYRHHSCATSIADVVRDRIAPVPYGVDHKIEGMLFAIAGHDLSLLPFESLPLYNANDNYRSEEAFEAIASFLEENAAEVAKATEWYCAQESKRQALSAAQSWERILVLNIKRAA